MNSKNEPNNNKAELDKDQEIEILKEKLHEAELAYSDKSIALIEITAARNALYKSLQDVQMRLADMTAQRDNDILAYEQELKNRLDEKLELQQKYDLLVIKGKRYDELQDSLMNIKMKAEARALNVIDEAQEKAMDAVNIIDNISHELDLFREDLVWLRKDIKIGVFTLDDRLDNLYKRLCQNMDRLTKIKTDFYQKNQLPLDSDFDDDNVQGIPSIKYPEEENKTEASPKADKQIEEKDTEALTPTNQ